MVDSIRLVFHYIHNPIAESQVHVPQSGVGVSSTRYKVNPSPGALYNPYYCKVQMVQK